VIVCEVAIRLFSLCLGKVTVSHRLSWRSKGDWGVTVLSSKSQLITKPPILGEYETSYQAAASVASRQSLPDLHAALRRFTPLARSEFEWGAVDALADELRKRNEQNPVL
jgi:hypothetical protein